MFPGGPLLASRRRDKRLEALHQAREAIQGQLLRAVAPGLGGIGMDFDQKAVRSIATAPWQRMATKSARPAPWLGSMTIGQCDSFLMMGTAEIRSNTAMFPFSGQRAHGLHFDNQPFAGDFAQSEFHLLHDHVRFTGNSRLERQVRNGGLLVGVHNDRDVRKGDT